MAPRKKIESEVPVVENVVVEAEVSNLDMTQVLKMMQEMQSQLNSLKKENETLKTPSTKKTEVDHFDPNRLVTVVHMDNYVERLYTVIRGDSEYSFNKMGDKQRIRLIELEKIVPKYSHFWNRGLLAFADEDVYDYFPSINKPTMIPETTWKNLSNLTPTDLGNLYSSVCKSHQEMIIRNWFLEYNNGNPSYKDFAKIAILDSLSNGILNKMIAQCQVDRNI